MVLRQIVDLAFDAPKIAPQPEEANDQKERGTVLCQQQGHGPGCLLCTGSHHYTGSRLFFNYMEKKYILKLPVICEKSRANRVTASRIRG